MIDLYRLLGIDRGATKSDIRKAYRKQAKAAHPDAGGSEEKFGALQLAHDVLTDEARRAKYDATGEIETAQPHNEHAQVLELLALMLGNILMGQPDPVQLDLVYVLDGILKKEIQEFRARQANLRRPKDRAEAMASRFHRIADGENALSALAQGKAREAEAALRQIDAAIAVRERAILFIADYRFDKVAPPSTNTVFSPYQQTAGLGIGNIFHGLGR